MSTANLTSVKTLDYVGNMYYEDGILKRILFEGGYYADGDYHFYLQNHLGDNNVVADKQGKVVQSNNYYPFGLSFADGSNPGKQPYKHSNKELDSDIGLNIYDSHARLYDPQVPRFLSMDPHAEKYYNISPYVYAANNPIRLIDPDGMDLYIFDEETGKYRTKLEREGTHRMAISGKDKKGNLTINFYDFADPENDPKSIEEGKINRFEMLSAGDVQGIVEEQGGFKIINGSVPMFARNGFSGKPFDYWGSEAIEKFMAKKGDNKSSSSLFIVQGDSYAHNDMNFGNFLWGVTGQSYGYSEKILLMGADIHSRFFNVHKEPDTPDDQLSISRGVRHAKNNNYRLKKKKWL